jgi:putative RNA 2'-phosphotransferase
MKQRSRKTKQQREKATIMMINSAAMYKDGKKFYKSENNVWLTDKVEAKYILYALSYDSIKDKTK